VPAMQLPFENLSYFLVNFCSFGILLTTFMLKTCNLWILLNLWGLCPCAVWDLWDFVQFETCAVLDLWDLCSSCELVTLCSCDLMDGKVRSNLTLQPSSLSLKIFLGDDDFWALKFSEAMMITETEWTAKWDKISLCNLRIWASKIFRLRFFLKL